MSTTLARKLMLAALVLGIGMALLPFGSASAAAPLADEGTPPVQVDTARLEQAYDRLNEWYVHQHDWMSKADANIARIQELINEATARGYDASAVQAALDLFAALTPQARVYNEQAGAILATHAGFDENGTVTDPAAAIETLRALHAALDTAYQTMGGENHAGIALREAIKAFLEANRPAPAA